MAKRKNKDPGRVRQVHPQKSFDQMVADATLAKFKGYLDYQLQMMGQALVQRTAQSTQNLFTRLVALEEIIIENNPEITKDVLADKVAAIQDRNEGFELVNQEVKNGDRVRLEIKTKTAEQTEFQGSSRLLVDNIGLGQTLGKELEESVLGMKNGETKETKFGKDATLTASITVNRISRQIEPAKSEEIEEAKVDESSTKLQETANASVNAG